MVKEANEVRSEVDRLRRVIVHPPGRCHELLQPRNIQAGPDYLLMDDILFVPNAQKEHDALVRTLGTAGEVFQFIDLLRETIVDSQARDEILKLVGLKGVRGLPDNPKELAAVLISGRLGERVFFHPAPNLIFTRDIAAVVGNAIVLSCAARFGELSVERPREREMALTAHIIRYHPLFAGYNVINVNNGRAGNGKLSCEGGDIQIVSPRVVMVGVSERTKSEAVNLMAPAFFKEGFECVLKVRLPKRHTIMHLDTVFTMLSPEECIIYEQLLSSDDISIIALTPRGKKEMDRTLLSVLADLDVRLNAYPCGGGDPLLADREQWTDGANVVALAPGVVVGYDRNVATAECLRRHGGYEVLTADEYIANPAPYLNDGRKALVLIPSGELSRGRGGPRCLSLPLSRG